MHSNIKLLLKEQDPSVCCLLDAHVRPIETGRLKVRGWKIIYHANGYEKQATREHHERLYANKLGDLEEMDKSLEMSNE